MTCKILCLNLLEGGQFWDNIKTFIEREQPDIVSFQEYGNGGEDQPLQYQSPRRFDPLLAGFEKYYSPELVQVWPTGPVEAGNCIYSRYPITFRHTVMLHGAFETVTRPADEKDFSHYPKNLQHVVVDVQGTPLHVCNLHGVWGQDGDDNPARLRMSELVKAEIADHQPLVLMGDFNLKPNTQTIANLETKLVNVFKDELTTTFNMRHKTNPGYATAVVDMFFATPDVKIINKACPEDDVSDHKPLVVTIEVP